MDNQNTGDPSLKIVHVMPQIGVGGAETQLCYLITNSPSDASHEVLYYSDSNDEKGYELYDKNNIKYTRVPRNKKRPFKFLKDFAKEIKKRNPDIVHCWLWSGNLWGRWAALLAGVENIIVAYRNCEIAYPFIVRNLERFTKNRVHYLANSRAGADYVAEKIGVNPDRFEVVYNGIDVSRFDVCCKREDVFAGLDIPANVKIITMVGRLTYQKNYPMLLKIAERCKDNNLPVRFMIVGHGEKEQQLKEMSTRMGLDDFVYFLGLRRDIPEILACSDIFCYTSFWEGFPNTLMEAMSAGLPIVTTDFDGVRELITDEVTGRIVSIDDIDSTVKILENFLNDLQSANGLGSAAKRTVRKLFSMKAMVDNTVSMYQNILEEE